MKYLKVTTLKKGWCDRDEIMLHATFQCLVYFVEKECCSDNPFQTDWNATEHHKKAWSEIKDLYQWWTKKRPARKSPLDRKGLKIPPFEFQEVPGKPFLKAWVPYDSKKYEGYQTAMKKYAQVEEQWEQEDQANLHRLIDIRLYLWT